MRITDAYTSFDRTIRSHATTGNGSSGPSVATAAQANKPGATSTKLSARAQELAQSAETVSPRVLELKQRMERGELKIDANDIARRMVGGDE